MHGVVDDIYTVLDIHVCVRLRFGVDGASGKIRCLSHCADNSTILYMRRGG